MNLEKYNTIYYFIENEISTKIAAFDLDYTLIKPKSNKLFPKDKDDWKFLYEKKIKHYLKNLINNGYSIVIFTNQKGLSQNKLTISDFSHKINEIKKNLDIQFSIFISTINDKFRKPLTGAWQFFCEKKKIKVDYDNSFYVGDAAGRKYNKGHDHTNDDRNFAFRLIADTYFQNKQYKNAISYYNKYQPILDSDRLRVESTISLCNTLIRVYKS